MKASVITIGDEILIGQIVDTNSQYIANKLHHLGVDLVETVSTSDTKQAILNSLENALSVADLVIITGGLGPTKDDITKHTLTAYFGDELVLNTDVLAQIESMFCKRGIPFGNLNKAQALLPSKAKILKNPIGTAAGMWFENQGKIVISLPGVPYEMKGILDNEVLPNLSRKASFISQKYQTYVLYGVGESTAAERLDTFENQLPGFVKLAYLPSPGRLRLRLTGKHQNEGFLVEELAKLGELLKTIFKGDSFEEGDVTYLELVKEELSCKNQTLSVAESCTGGKIAYEITKQEGASSFFLGGVVAYNKSLKEQLLQVKSQTIQQHSVVSKQVAREMVINMQQLTNSDYAVATTGNAGPLVDNTPEVIGVVFIAIATPNKVWVEKFNFGQPRQKVIEQAKNKAFEMLGKEILKNH